jgi:hypothetical protein
MKATKLFIYLILVAIVFTNCTQHDTAELGIPFVRFRLLVNSNGQILQFPTVNQSIVETAEFEQVNLNTIKIPVVLSGPLQETPTDVFYEVISEGNFSEFTVSPENKITIQAGTLIDTLRISFQNRWSQTESNSIKIRITGTSNPAIQIGWPNETRKMNEITINLGNLEQTRYFFNQNLYNLAGTLNEELLIPISFSQPVTNSMIGDFDFIHPTFEVLSLCDGEGAVFDYSLEKLPFEDGATTIFYKLKLLETNPFASNLKLSLNTGLTDVVVFGINQVNIFKPIFIVRQGDVATNFYNVSDALYRTFGKAWYFNPSTNSCDWSNFNTFVKPVPVPPGSEFDNGNGFHKYRIGFVANTPPVGTNPFDLRRYYAGTRVTSPAFNIIQAIEFFPENGNSTTQGTVKVVPQTLTFIKTSNDAVVNVPVCGSGNYFFDSTNNRWVIYVELHCDETQINGNNNVIKPMYIYSNNNNFVDPPALSIPCPTRLNL